MYTFSGSPEGHEHLDVMHKLLKQFVPFAQKRLGFNKPVEINLLSDPQNSKDPLGKTAYYDPNNMKIALFVDKRHPKDLMRSLAHELTHHAQNCRGEFDNLPKLGEDYAQTNQHMREMEREAYEGTMLLRDFEDNLKKETTQMNENKINEQEPGVAAARATIDPFSASPSAPADILTKSQGQARTTAVTAGSSKLRNLQTMLADAKSLLQNQKFEAAMKLMDDMERMFDEVVKQATGPMEEDQELEEGKKKKKKSKKTAKLQNAKKADLNKDGKLSGYELARGKAIEKAMGVAENKENWTKGSKDELLFESLTKKWTK